MWGKWLSRSSWLFQHDPRGHLIIKVYLDFKITYLPICHLFTICLSSYHLSIHYQPIYHPSIYHLSLSIIYLSSICPSSIYFSIINHLCIYASSTYLSICLSVSHLVSMAPLYPLSPTNMLSYVSISLGSLLWYRGVISSRVMHTEKCVPPYQWKSFWQQPPTSTNCPVRQSITIGSPTSTSRGSIIQHALEDFLSSVFSHCFSVALLDDMS